MTADAGAAFYEALLDDDPDDLYDNAPCAYLSTLPDGHVVKVNGTFLTWTGYDRAELVGVRRFPDLLAPGDRIYYATHVAPLLLMQDHVREVAVDVVHRSGARLPVIVSAALKRDARGEPYLVRIAMFDATERRSYERELLAARERAEESEARATALARTLQASLLPPATLDVPGLDVAGAYRPAGDGSEVGGDFYDVFETGRGTWGIVLGDVCGKGAAAAVLTSLARYAVRAEAPRTSSPSVVLTGLHEALLRHHPDKFCTALLLLLDRTERGVRLTMSSGGHHLPLRLRADGGWETLGEPGTIIGMLDVPHLVDTTTMLDPGDVVVLFTDGVVEARADAEFFGEERLRAAVAAARATTAQDVADHVVGAALDFQHGDARDDIAVVVVTVPPR